MAPGKASSLAFDASTVIVVTGSNRSLGFHLTKAFLETTESHVVATARNIDKADALRELAVKFSDRVQLVQLDTENEDSVKAAAAEVAERHDGIDLLFNNAGIQDGAQVKPLDLSPKQYEHILKVNVVGPFLTTTAFLPLLRKKQSRVVVNMSSGLGSIAANRQASGPTANGTAMNTLMLGYCSSKAALNMQNSILANVLGAEGFCCLALCPGWTQTDMGMDTAQKLGIKAAPLTVEQSIKQQLEVLRGLTPANNGEYRNFEGKIDW